MPTQWNSGEIESESNKVTWGVEEVPDEPRSLWQFDWQQAPDEHGVVWMTKCQLSLGTPSARFTVRISVDFTDSRIAPMPYVVGRPGVIWRLAEATGIHADGWPLDRLPARIGSDDVPRLLGLLLDQDRQLPVVVVTPAEATGVPLINAARLTDRLLGIAHVVEISAPPVTYLLTERLASPLTVFGGAIRLYWPGLTVGADPFRHPLWLPWRIESLEASAKPLIDRLEQLIAGVAVVHVSPDPLEAELRAKRDTSLLGRLSDLQSQLRRVSEGSKADEELGELLELADEDIRGLKTETRRLQEDNERLHAELEDVRKAFASYAQSLGTGPDDAASPPTPDTASSSSEAFAHARAHLPGVAIPEDAARSLAELDAATEAGAWGNSAWRAFRALDAYARESTQYGGFWDWCERSGSGLWPATPKKLAMKESETVMNSRELREKRRFPVDTRVDSSGTIVMQAHIKVSEGGGPQAPRIYFHDDTKGTTGQVHVGFFGPHRFVPNKGAN